MAEVIGYFIFFWAFVFSSKFRRIAIQDWTEFGVLGKLGMMIEVFTSTFCGVVLPAYILFEIIKD